MVIEDRLKKLNKYTKITNGLNFLSIQKAYDKNFIQAIQGLSFFFSSTRNFRQNEPKLVFITDILTGIREASVYQFN